MTTVTLRPDSGILRRTAEAFADLGARISTTAGVPSPEALTQLVVDTIPGAQFASLTVQRGSVFVSKAWTDDRAKRADDLQYELGTGPCVDAIADDTVYCPRNLRDDPRWPEYGRRVADEMGVDSMLSYRLVLDGEDVLAGLNVYGLHEDAFDDEAVALGLLLATHAANVTALALARSRVENLQKALTSNREIGVAIGVLMSVHRLTRDQAFDLLKIASQNSNRKLHDLALEVADTGSLPLPPKRGARAPAPRPSPGRQGASRPTPRPGPRPTLPPR